MDLDTNSRRILRELQKDATLSSKELAGRLSMSPSTVWRRLQDLENAGYFKTRGAVLDAQKLGLEICAIIEVNVEAQDATSRARFESFVQADPRITQCFSMTGGHDYLLITYARSVQEFEDFLMNALLAHSSVAGSDTAVVLKQIKNTTALPV